VFVGPVERCSLENFSSVWHAAAACVQTFQKKKENRCKLLVMWNVWKPNPGSPRVSGYSRVFPVCILALLANGHTFRNDKRVHEKWMLGIEVL
jgi:hypothetical protein